MTLTTSYYKDKADSTNPWEVNLEEFIQYCLKFYGKGGIYDMQADRESIEKALVIMLIQADKDYYFEGDSMDRERIRDTLVQYFGAKFPTR